MVEEEGNWVEMKGGNDFTFRYAQFEPLANLLVRGGCE